ncbi:MAG: ComF family protein [Oscillospiraceae bacterium]
MSKLLDWVLDAIYPTRCILCRERQSPGRPTICPSCQTTMPSAIGDHKKGDYFSECVSALYYEGPVKLAVRRYKFQEAQAYAPAFGELIAERIYEELDGKYDLLSWVPLAPDRLRKRGYDQSQLLAENAARRLQKPLVRLLKKRRGVSAQSLAKDADQRRKNIAGAYRVVDPEQVAGRRILLIDDIVTTGSTLSECAKTLLKAGAEEVMCATLAMTR